MAFFSWSSSVAAAASYGPLDQSGNSWKYQYAPYDVVCEGRRARFLPLDPLPYRERGVG